MKRVLLLGLLTSSLSIAGCMGIRYSEPEFSGLDAVAPFPTSGDVCMSLNANDATASVSSAQDGLIACPNHEKGAIGDRIRDGFSIAGEVDAWTVLQSDAP